MPLDFDDACAQDACAQDACVGVDDQFASETMFFPASEWFAAFVLTIAVEVPVVLFMLRRVEPDLPRLAILVIFANLATHPAVWFVFTQLFLVGTPAFVVAAESWAIGIEAIFYALVLTGVGPRRALAVALAANLASIVVGRLFGQSLLETIR